jgi:8-oxo-dGTP pyrophosphatase MutT (NUDIX family)
MHLTEKVLAPIRARYGDPAILEWKGEISEREYDLATYNPRRTHDVTLFILHGSRLALIRKHPFPPEVRRPPGGGVRPGEEFVEAVTREAYEETGLRVELERYLVEARARFLYDSGLEAPSAKPPAPGQESSAPPARHDLDWRTHVFLATTEDEELEPQDTEEIAATRWGTLEELAGPLRERLLATGRAFWRYRVALHDAALAELGR